jgi:hypothetical protein
MKGRKEPEEWAVRNETSLQKVAKENAIASRRRRASHERKRLAAPPRLYRRPHSIVEEGRGGRGEPEDYARRATDPQRHALLLLFVQEKKVATKDKRGRWFFGWLLSPLVHAHMTRHSTASRSSPITCLNSFSSSLSIGHEKSRSTEQKPDTTW